MLHEIELGGPESLEKGLGVVELDEEREFGGMGCGHSLVLIIVFKRVIQSKMMKKAQTKRKKMANTSSQNMRSVEKPIKISLKNTLDVFFPRQAGSTNANSKGDLAKTYKSSLVSPKCRSSKKMVKENPYMTVTNTRYCSPISTPIEASIELVSKKRNDFKFIYQIGSGGFGRVWKVQDKRSNEILAMKEMSKAKVVMKKSVSSVVNEKNLLLELQSNFIINIKSVFQDRDYLYLGMEYLRGGDLRYHLCFYEFFSEEQTRFIAASIILSLEYIHAKGIIHRDLKPQNLVFEENGYVRLTDFGVARKLKSNNSQETSGTPGYMSPEVICRMNHAYEADFFALGVIVYEMMLGSRPYMGDTRKEIRDKILAHQAKISKKQLPYGWSENSIDFVNKLLKRNRENRLGYNGVHELKSHPWLAPINWRKLERKEVKPPFVPGIISESHEYQREMENSLNSEVNEQAIMLLRTEEFQNVFKEYDINPSKKGMRLY